MADDLRERLLASYAHLGEAMVVQNVLEAAGVACRVADLAQVPSHVFGIAGGMGRSVGLWVLARDVEKATSLLATAGATENAVDEEALAAEALAAGRDGGAERDDQGIAPVRPHARNVRAPRFPWLAGAVIAVLAVLGARGCG